jgi:hypothetical protein
VKESRITQIKKSKKKKKKKKKKRRRRRRRRKEKKRIPQIKVWTFFLFILQPNLLN